MAINFDIQDFKSELNNISNKLNSYFKSLNKNEKIGWILIAAGLVLLIIGSILW